VKSGFQGWIQSTSRTEVMLEQTDLGLLQNRGGHFTSSEIRL